MADDMTVAYAKLTQTPLAKSTTCFGLSAATWTIIIGILSMFLNVLPGFIIAVQVSKEWDNLIEKPELKLKNLSLGLLVIWSIIQLICTVLVIIGGMKRQPTCLYCWFIWLIFLIFFGRLVCGGVLLSIKLRGLSLIVFALSIVDVVVAGLLATCGVQLTGEYRNEKYKNLEREVRNRDEERAVQVNLLPSPGSYPTQTQ